MTFRTGATRRWTALSAAMGLLLLLTACAPQRGPEGSPESTEAPACATTWCLVAREDFTKPAALGTFEQVYGSNLNGYPSGHVDTSGNGRYVPERVLSASDGMLDWWVHTEGGQPMTAAPLPQGYVGQRYGRWVVRFRADRAAGFKLAFLLWPDSDRWADGEIDFPEGELGQAIYGFSHNVDGNPGHNQFKFDPQATMTGWHTATIEWLPDHITFTLDGASKTTTDPAAMPKRGSFHPVLQVETSLEGPAPAQSTQGHVQVDWFSTYSWNPHASSAASAAPTPRA